MSQGFSSATIVEGQPVGPEISSKTRRQQIASRAKESLESLKENLKSTSVNLDVIRQYRRARPIEEGVDSPTKQLEVNLEVEIQGLERRIQTTKSLVENLDEMPTATPLSPNDSTK
jgi:hypothetical protein